MLKVVINSNRCLGCACCVDIAPSLFVISSEDHSKYIGPQETTGTGFDSVIETIKLAVLTCPVKAIDLRI